MGATLNTTNTIDYIVESYTIISESNVKLMINGSCVGLYKPLSEYTIVEVAEVPNEVYSHKFKYENNEYVYIPSYISTISKKELLDRITEIEINNMINYTQHIDSLAITDTEKTTLKVKMSILWEKWRCLNYIDLDNLTVILEFSNTLVNAQIVSSERMSQIVEKQFV